ncbi:hypothetical protein AVEN_139807-1, partial [Araneus ventricosus]
KRYLKATTVAADRFFRSIAQHDSDDNRNDEDIQSNEDFPKAFQDLQFL